MRSTTNTDVDNLLSLAEKLRKEMPTSLSPISLGRLRKEFVGQPHEFEAILAKAVYAGQIRIVGSDLVYLI